MVEIKKHLAGAAAEVPGVTVYNSVVPSKCSINTNNAAHCQVLRNNVHRMAKYHKENSGACYVGGLPGLEKAEAS